MSSKFKVEKAQSPADALPEAPRRKVKRKKEIASYSLDPDLVEKIKRWAYRDRKSNSEIMEAILKGALDGKEFPAIPTEKPIVLD